MSSLSRAKIRCREITNLDASNVVDLLTRGFPRRNRQYWQRALQRLAKHPTPEGFPKYGYLLEANDRIVGVILLIYNKIETSTGPTVRCSVSSWYLEPQFRIYATLLTSLAFKNKNVTYLNVSPANHVQKIIEAQGFSRYCRGALAALPILARRASDARVLGGGMVPDAPFEPFERQLILSHITYGCIGMWCVTRERAYPFVFAPRIAKGVVPCAQLIYCRQIDDLVRFAGRIGWFLSLRGRPWVLIDSNGPIQGLVGRYFEDVAPKYFKGPDRPRLGDLSYTEAGMFIF